MRLPAALINLEFLLTCLTLGFLAFLFVLVARRKDRRQIHNVFLVNMATIFLWSLGAVILQYGDLMGQPTRAWAVYLAYVGLILTPVGALLLGVVFARTRIRLAWKHALFLVIPALSLVLLFTNNLHHLFYRTIEYKTLTQAASLGDYFIVHTIYSYLCIVAGMGQLAYFSIKNAGFFSRQSIFILLGIIVSTAYNLLLTAQVIQGYFHTNVISFFITFLLFYFAILKFDFLNIVPIALQRVVDHISDSFLVIDRDGVIVDYNRTFTDTFGEALKIARKDRLDTLIERRGCTEEFAALLCDIREVLVRKERGSLDRTLTIQGQARHFSIEISILDDRGLDRTSIVLLKDITQVRNAMETIQRNNELLMEKERLASLGQMVGGIAHNLKTPIMSISGAVEGLRDLVDEYDGSVGDATVTEDDHHEIAREMRGWIDKIKPHCAYMSDIISTVKGQTAQFSATSSSATFTLDELLKRVDLLMKHELKRFHCEFQVAFETDPHLEMLGDISSLVQVFDNLILNAIHAYDGRSGVIDLAIREEGGQVVFAFTDHGKGIPQAVQERLFREMVTTKGKMGTGLGLFMSAATVRAQFNGRIWFTSTPGLGSTFYVAIPVLRPGRAPGEIAEVPSPTAT